MFRQSTLVFGPDGEQKHSLSLLFMVLQSNRIVANLTT